MPLTRALPALILAAATAVAIPATAAATPVVQGNWRTDGYGQYIRVDGDRVTRFDTTAVSCVPAGTGTAVGRRAPDGAVRFDVPDDDAITLRAVSPRRAVEHVDSATSHRDLRRVPALPRRCATTPADDPRSVFDVFWSTFAQNYPFFALHGVDWTAVRARYRPMVTKDTSPARLYDILAATVAPLHDAHVAILGPGGALAHEVRPGSPDATPQLDVRLKDVLTRVDLPSVGGTAPVEHARGRIAVAELPGSIGYLRVSGFTGYTGDDSEPANRAELQRVLRTVFTRGAVDSWHGLLLDLRINGGGSDALAIDLAQHLTRNARFGYAKQYRTNRGTWSAPQPTVVVPARGPVFTGPVAVMTSGATQSAGETFVQALLTRRPRPTIVGENTQGVFSDTLTRTLPNGWTVLLPNERYLTARGVSFDGRGIAPDLRRPLVTSGPVDAQFTTAYDVLTRR